MGSRTLLAGAAVVLMMAAAVWTSRDDGPPPATKTLDIPSQYKSLPKAHAWERAQWHVQKRLAEGQERIPMNALEPARQAMAKMLQSNAATIFAKRHPGAPKSASAWQSLGPNFKGGRTRRIVFDSKDTMFAAGVSGGVWQYQDRTGSWTPLGDELVNANVGALVISPTDDAVMYAGTGELYRRTNRPYSSMTGSGIFKSTNAGQDWVQLSATTNDDFVYVSDIVISPHDSDRLYAATNSGVWRSDDGGVSFVQTLTSDEGSGSRYEGCTDLALRTDLQSDWILATCSSRSEDDRYHLPGLLPGACDGPCDGRIYLNQDAAVSDAWDVVLTETGLGRTSLSIFPGNQEVLYALSASTVPGPDKTGDGRGDYDNGLHAVFRSNDGGQNWTATLRNTDPDPVSTWMLSFAFQARGDNQTPYGAGWYNQAIVVDPLDPDIVWVGGMQLYRSDDGGRSFGLTSNYFADSDVPASFPHTMHPDIHALVHDAGGNLMIGNDGGVWWAANQYAATDRVNDGYYTPVTNGVVFNEQVFNYTTTQFYHGSVSPDGNLVIGGMQDNGTDVLNLPGFEGRWVTAFGGDGAYSAYNPDGPFYYFAAQNASIGRMNADYQFTYLRDLIWAQALDPDEFMFITPFTLDPSDRSRIYVAGKRLFRGSAHGDFWTRASAPFGTSFQDKANAIAVSPTRSIWVLIGTGNAIYKNSPSSISGPLNVPTSTRPRSGWVSSLIFDPNDEMIAYATYSSFGGDHVWKSTDGGESFFPIDGQGAGRLPDVPVHSLAIDPANTDHLYIGTDLGVFFTENGGESWQVEQTGFGGAIVERVVINQPEDAGTAYLFAFTYGRGVWRVPLAEVDGRPDVMIGPSVNGFWFDAREPGHGIQVQAIDSNGELKLLVTWYVYHQGQPMWLIGVGDVELNRAFVPMQVTRGTGFGDNFDPADVVYEDWGILELVFDSETELSFRWISEHIDKAGTLTMDRLSRPVDIEVAGAPVGLCSTGVYFNADQSGHGIVGETVMLGDQPGYAWSWFNYRDGEQLWLVGSGVFEGNRVLSTAQVGVTGEFPPDFRAANAQADIWGTVEFVFDEERQFTLNWTPKGQPEQPGSLAFEQLATIADSGCQ